MTARLLACGGLLFVLQGAVVRVLRDRAVVALWRFRSAVVAVSEAAAAPGSFLVLDAEGRLETATLERDDRSSTGTRLCRLTYPSPVALSLERAQPNDPAQQEEGSSGDIFEQEIQLGRRPEQQSMPAAKRARTLKEDQVVGSSETLGQCTGVSCALCATGETLYCGRINLPLVQCQQASGRLAIDAEGTDDGTRCLLAVAVDDVDTGGTWPGLVRIEARLMGALCGTELALRAKPILLQGGADGCLRATAASAPTSASALRTVLQHTVCTVHEPIVCVLALRSAVLLIGASGRLIVITAGEDGRRQTYQRQLPGPIDSAAVLRQTAEDDILSDMVLLIAADRALYATRLQFMDRDGTSALHRLPLGRGAEQVSAIGATEAAVLLDDTGGPPRSVDSRLLWLTSKEVLQHMRSGLYTLDAAWRSRQDSAGTVDVAARASSNTTSGTAESAGSETAGLRLKSILSEISMLNGAERALEMQHKAANSRLAAVHGAVSALQFYGRPGGRPPRVGFRFKSVSPGVLHQTGGAQNHAQDGVLAQIALEVLFDNPAAPFSLLTGSGSEVWSLSVQLSEVDAESSLTGGKNAESVAPGGQRWNFSFGLPHGMERQARLLAPLPADLVDLARRAPLQLSYHLTMQFGDGNAASAKAGFVLPLYRQSSGGQSVVYRQADVLHFLHPVPKPAGKIAGASKAMPSRLSALQQLFHPAASALFTCRDTENSSVKRDGKVAARMDNNTNTSNALELVMRGIQPTLTAVTDGGGSSRHQVVVPPQPSACKVLHQILNDGGQGGAVVAALQAEMDAAASAPAKESGSGLEASASVGALFGPTGSIVRIGVQRILHTTAVNVGEQPHTLAVYRLHMYADSLAVLALLHSALIHRAVKIDESARRGWQRLASAVAPQPALSQVVMALHRAQEQLQRQQQQQQHPMQQHPMQQPPQQQEREQQHAVSMGAATGAPASGAAAQSQGATLSLQHRRIAKLLRVARDEELSLRQKHQAMCDAESLAQLSVDLKSQADNLIDIWKALRTAVAL